METLEKKPNNLQIWLAEFLKKYFSLLLFILVIIFFLIAYYFILVPRFQKAVEVIHASSSDQEKKYIQVVQKLTDLTSLSSSYKKIDPEVIKKVEAFLPSEYVQEQLFLELEQVIIKKGYIVNSISVQKEIGSPVDNNAQRIGRVKVSIDVSAVDYHDFKALLAVLESNIRLMDVDTLSFSPGGQSASFTFYTYFLKEK